MIKKNLEDKSVKIIDSHVHLGDSRVTTGRATEESLLKDIEINNLFGMCVLPLPEPYPDSFTLHNRIDAMSKANPGKFWGVIDINPRHDDDEYNAEVARCVNDLGFVAVKMHPYLESTKPHDRHAVKIYEAAIRHNIPMIVHTGMGVPQALPSMMIKIAKKYPELVIVLAHSGGPMYFDEAVAVASMFDNVFLETSQCSPHQIRGGINELGASKLMFGSDGGTKYQLDGVLALGIPDGDLEQYLSGTAIDVFKLKF